MDQVLFASLMRTFSHFEAEIFNGLGVSGGYQKTPGCSGHGAMVHPQVAKAIKPDSRIASRRNEHLNCSYFKL